MAVHASFVPQRRRPGGGGGSKLPELDVTQELTPLQMARWSLKRAGRAEATFPQIAAIEAEARATLHGASSAGTAKAGTGPRGHVGTSAAGARLEANTHTLADASLGVQHAVTLGAIPSRIDLKTANTIGVSSASLRADERLTIREGAVFRQDALVRNAMDKDGTPLLERRSQTFPSAAGASRIAVPNEVHAFRLPFTIKRPKQGAWQDWTDDAVQELELERQLRIRCKRKRRRRGASTGNGDLDTHGGVDDDDEDGVDGGESDDESDTDEGEPPVRLSMRKSMVLLQSLRQSRLLHMTALLPPFAIRNVQASGESPVSNSSRVEYTYVSPLPPSLTHNFDLRLPHYLIQLGCADVRIGPHLYTRTKFWEVRPDVETIRSTHATRGRTLSLAPDSACLTTTATTTTATFEPVPLEGDWAEGSDLAPRPPIIIVEFRENPGMRYTMPLWATAVECTRYTRRRPADLPRPGSKMRPRQALVTQERAEYEILLTFGVPALGSAGRSHSAAIMSEELGKHQKAAKEKRIRDAERRKEEAAREAAEAAERERIEAEAATAAATAAAMADPEDENHVEAKTPMDTGKDGSPPPEPRGITTRSRQQKQVTLQEEAKNASNDLDRVPSAEPATSAPTVPTRRAETPPPLPVSHPTLGLKNQDWLVTWRLRGEGSSWTGLPGQHLPKRHANMPNEPSFDVSPLDAALREAFGRVPGAMQFDHFPDLETQEEASARKAAELDAAESTKKRGKKRKVNKEPPAAVDGAAAVANVEAAGPSDAGPPSAPAAGPDSNAAGSSTAADATLQSTTPAPAPDADPTVDAAALKKAKKKAKQIKNAKRVRLIRKIPSTTCWPALDPDSNEAKRGAEHLAALTRAFAGVLGSRHPAAPERTYPVLSLEGPQQLPPGLKEEVADPHRPLWRVLDEAPVAKRWRREEDGGDEWALVEAGKESARAGARSKRRPEGPGTRRHDQ